MEGRTHGEERRKKGKVTHLSEVEMDCVRVNAKIPRRGKGMEVGAFVLNV